MKPLFKIFLVAVSTALIAVSCSNQPKLAYVDIAKIYNEISLAKELQEKLTFMQNNYEQLVLLEKKDLERLVSSTSANSSQEELKKVFVLQKKVDSLSNYYAKQLADTAAFYNKQLESRVNQLVFEFGKKSQYDYIFSPGSSNGFMYADSTDDVTKEALSYIESALKN